MGHGDLHGAKVQTQVAEVLTFATVALKYNDRYAILALAASVPTSAPGATITSLVNQLPTAIVANFVFTTATAALAASPRVAMGDSVLGMNSKATSCVSEGTRRRRQSENQSAVMARRAQSATCTSFASPSAACSLSWRRRAQLPARSHRSDGLRVPQPALTEPPRMTTLRTFGASLEGSKRPRPCSTSRVCSGGTAATFASAGRCTSSPHTSMSVPEVVDRRVWSCRVSRNTTAARR